MSDFIKREDAIEVAYQLRHKPNDDEWNWWLRSFNAIPTIDAVEVVRGEWKNHKDEHYCTNCGEVVIGDWCDTDDWYDFCPWCGARMEGADDEVR